MKAVKRWTLARTLAVLIFCACLSGVAGSCVADRSEPQSDVSASAQSGPARHCTLLIECKTVLSSANKLKANKRELIPENGVIFESDGEFFDGESVFDVLLRETRNNEIHMEFKTTLVDGGHYINGINNLYELDCGKHSYWLYRVNGWGPGFGCNYYTLQDGDVIQWLYTCDLGRDLDPASATRNVTP